MLDAFVFTMIGAVAFLLGVSYAQRKPWPHDYLGIRFAEIESAENGGHLGQVTMSRFNRFATLCSAQSRSQKRFTRRHEEAHVVLNDLAPDLSLEQEEAIADLIAYARTLAAGERLTKQHSYSESYTPGSVCLTLDQAFECLRLAQHLQRTCR